MHHAWSFKLRSVPIVLELLELLETLVKHLVCLLCHLEFLVVRCQINVALNNRVVLLLACIQCKIQCFFVVVQGLIQFFLLHKLFCELLVIFEQEGGFCMFSILAELLGLFEVINRHLHHVLFLPVHLGEVNADLSDVFRVGAWEFL